MAAAPPPIPPALPVATMLLPASKHTAHMRSLGDLLQSIRNGDPAFAAFPSAKDALVDVINGTQRAFWTFDGTDNGGNLYTDLTAGAHGALLHDFALLRSDLDLAVAKLRSLWTPDNVASFLDATRAFIGAVQALRGLASAAAATTRVSAAIHTGAEQAELVRELRDLRDDADKALVALTKLFVQDQPSGSGFNDECGYLYYYAMADRTGRSIPLARLFADEARTAGVPVAPPPYRCLPLVGDVVNAALALALVLSPDIQDVGVRQIAENALQYFDADPLREDRGMLETVRAGVYVALAARIARAKPGLVLRSSLVPRLQVVAPYAVPETRLDEQAFVPSRLLDLAVLVLCAEDDAHTSDQVDEAIAVGVSWASTLTLPLYRKQVQRYRGDLPGLPLQEVGLRAQMDALVEGALGPSAALQVSDDTLARCLAKVLESVAGMGLNRASRVWEGNLRREAHDALFGQLGTTKLSRAERMTVDAKLARLGLFPAGDPVFVTSASDSAFEAIGLALCGDPDIAEPDKIPDNKRRALGFLAGSMAVSARMQVAGWATVTQCVAAANPEDLVLQNPVHNTNGGAGVGRIELDTNVMPVGAGNRFPPRVLPNPLALATPMGLTGIELFAMSTRLMVQTVLEGNCSWATNAAAVLADDTQVTALDDLFRKTDIPSPGLLIVSSHTPHTPLFTGLTQDGKPECGVNPVAAAGRGGVAVLLAPSPSRPVWSVLPVADSDGRPVIRWDAVNWYRQVLIPRPDLVVPLLGEADGDTATVAQVDACSHPVVPTRRADEIAELTTGSERGCWGTAADGNGRANNGGCSGGQPPPYRRPQPFDDRVSYAAWRPFGDVRAPRRAHEHT